MISHILKAGQGTDDSFIQTCLDNESFFLNLISKNFLAIVLIHSENQNTKVNNGGKSTNCGVQHTFLLSQGGEFSRYQNWHSQVFIKYIELSSGYMLFDLKVHQFLFLRSILTIHHSKIKFYTILCYAIVLKNLKKVVVRFDFLNKNSTI